MKWTTNRKAKMCRLLLYMVASLFSLSTVAQTVKISGKVSDEAGDPIEFAGVYTLTGTGGVTDLQGKYSFVAPYQDTIKLVISCMGYHKVTRKIVKPEKEVSLNVVLQTSYRSLQEVTVKELKRETEMVEKLDAKHTRLMPDAAGGSIESLIKTFAGVSSNNEMSSQYMVRGGNYDENSVYVNGIEVYRPLLIRSGQQEGLSFINPDMVRGVNFSAGGFDARYGDKMSSVLDIVYKRPQDFEGSFAASLQGGSLYLGSAGKRHSQIHGLRYKRNASLLGTLDMKGEYKPTFIDYQTYMTFQLAPRWELSILGNISNNTFSFVPQTRKTRFGTQTDAKEFKVYFDGQEKDRFQTLFGAVTLNYKLNSVTDLGLQISAFNTHERESYDITGQYWLREIDQPVNSQLDNTLGVASYHEHARNRLHATVFNISHIGTHKREKHLLSWGVGVQLESIKDRMREWEWRDSAGYSMPFFPEQVNVIYNLYSHNQVKNTRFLAYFQDTYRMDVSSGFLSLTGGIRANYWSFNNEFLVSPRVSLAFIPNWERDFTFRLATGLYYQSPFYKEYRDSVNRNGNYIIELNKDIRSQRSVHLIAGMDHYFYLKYRPFKFTVETYFKHIDRLIPYNVDNVRVLYSGRNNGKGYVMGLDMKLFGEMIPGVDSWISFSLMKSREKFAGKSMPRPTDQRYNVSLFFQDYFPNNPKYKMQLKLVFADGLPFGPPRDEMAKASFRMAPYRRVDIGLSRQLVGGEDRIMRRPFFRHLKNIWLGLDVFNILNINNINSYYWVTDIHDQQYAVPNYLTSRMVNLRLVVDF